MKKYIHYLLLFFFAIACNTKKENKFMDYKYGEEIANKWSDEEKNYFIMVCREKLPERLKYEFKAANLDYKVRKDEISGMCDCMLAEANNKYFPTDIMNQPDLFSKIMKICFDKYLPSKDEWTDIMKAHFTKIIQKKLKLDTDNPKQVGVINCIISNLETNFKKPSDIDKNPEKLTGILNNCIKKNK